MSREPVVDNDAIKRDIVATFARSTQETVLDELVPMVRTAYCVGFQTGHKQGYEEGFEAGCADQKLKTDLRLD